MEIVAVGVIAGLLTYFDLDVVFDIPQKINKRLRLSLWLIGFVGMNGILACLAYHSFATLPVFAELNPWVRVLTIALGYRAVISSKVATIELQGNSVPFGLELFYEKAKNFIFKRINMIVREARIVATNDLANSFTLDQLVLKANEIVWHDALLTVSEKVETKEWIHRVRTEKSSDDLQKKNLIAQFILLGKRQ